MSPCLADLAPDLDPVKAANTLRARLHGGALPIGAARRSERPAALAGEGLSSLDALPWFAPSGADPAAALAGRNPAARARTGMMLHVGLAAALALLGGGAWYAAGDTAAPPAPAMQQARASRDNPPASPSPAATSAATETAAGLAADAIAPVEAQQNRIAAPTRPASSAEAARIRPVAAAQSSTPALPAAPPAARPTAAAIAESVVAPPPPPLADSPVTNATLRQYRTAMDEARDAIRAIIRLGDRQRPGREASAAEQASYRLRQQNAEAAKTYRTYLDTLARSVRGTNSETLTRQSLERARQTLGYLNAMLADSKASLR